MKYFLLSLCGLLLLTSSVKAEGEHYFYSNDSALGSVDNYQWGQAFVSQDSGTLDSISVRGMHYGGTNKYNMYLYYCDLDMTPDFGQELTHTSGSFVLDETSEQWVTFPFDNPVQINQNYCYYFVVVQQDSGYPFTSLASNEFIYSQSVYPFKHMMWIDIDGTGFVSYPGLSMQYNYTLSGDVIYTGNMSIINTTQDIAYGLILFLIMFFGLIFYFRKGVR